MSSNPETQTYKLRHIINPILLGLDSMYVRRLPTDLSVAIPDALFEA